MSADETPDASAMRRPTRRGLWIRSALVGLVVLLILAIAVPQLVAESDDDGGPPATTTTSTTARPTTSTSTSTSTTTTIPPTTTTTIPPQPQPPNVELPPPPGGSVRQGDVGLEIAAYEQRLADLKFDPGPIDGRFDEKTRFAVEAVDKLFGWPRDGVIDQDWVNAMNVFQFPYPLVTDNPEPDRIEIDLDKQVLTVYRGYHVALITTTSTGNGKRFCGGSDGCQYAVTPVGKYHITWHVNGWRDGDLGRLYNPWYFNGGIAVHGYPQVPVKPASHGCARVPMHVSEVINDLVFKGMPVYVLGEQVPKGGYPADHPNGGSIRSNGSSSAPPSPPATPAPPPPPPPPAPDTAPPETAPPETAPPETVPPETTPPAGSVETPPTPTEAPPPPPSPPPSG